MYFLGCRTVNTNDDSLQPHKEVATWIQYKQCTCDVTMRRVRETIVAAEKQ
jgi:hypothetical protein